MPTRPRRRVLVISQYYEPATGGGTIVDAVGAVRAAARAADVWVLAGDHDLGDGPRLAVPVGGWHDHPGDIREAKVRHVSFGRASLGEVRRAVREVEPDVVLVFSTWATGSLAALTLHRFRRFPRSTALVLAPAGELFEGALRQQARKKQVVLKLGRLTGLWRGVTWRASDQDEAAIIRSVFPGARVGVAPVLPAPRLASPPSEADRLPRHPDQPVRLVSVGTVGVKKGLDQLLDHIAAAGRAGVPVHLDVFGAEIDPTFSARCRAKVNALPPSCRAELHGLRGHPEIAMALARADAFALATQGENYGVAVLEALDAGLPVLISDTTPWRGLQEAGCGWDLPPSDTDGWVEALTELRDAATSTRTAWMHAALRRADQARREAEADGTRAWRHLLGLAEAPNGEALPGHHAPTTGAP